MIMQHHKAWRFRVRFAGSTAMEYWSPDVRRSDPGWSSVDFGGGVIASIDFHLPTGHVLRLAGMEAYCFFVEASQSLGGRDGAKIEAFWFCGRLPRRLSQWVDMWRVADGRVVRCRKPYGAEWGGTPIAGWKPGTVGGQVFSGIVGGG